MGGVAIVVFSDLVDSTALLASLGDDRMELVRRAHVDDVTEVVAASGGRVVKTLGDGVMASFESALGALRGAAGIQAAVERLDVAHGEIGIAARVGVAAGEPIPDGEDLHGMTVVIASRLSSSAGAGEVLVQDLVHGLVASRDGVTLDVARDFDLKGVPDPVRASNLRWRELVPAAGTTVALEVGQDVAAGSPGRTEDAGRSGTVRVPPLLAAYAEEPLIGRDREITALREATAARPGRRAVLVLGEPGIGKTRHAAAAAIEAHSEGALVVLARCPPEAVIAFEPWVRAIGELALAGDDAWREALAAAAGAELAALVPELSEHASLADRAVADEFVAAEGARYRLLRGIAAALAFAAGEAPLHVVLDDAHWCDPASAQALGHLLESTPTQLVLVVTARDREMGRSHPVSKVLTDLRRTGDLHELRLDGLDASGLAALVGAKVGRAITPGLAARLLARTSGNPFFAGELARDLDGRGALKEGDMLEAAPVPEAVADLVEERLGRLDGATERLLTAVAAIGPAAPVGLAARAAGLGPEEAERAVAEALAERLVDDVVAVEPTIEFPHALVREALIAGTGDADRARLHLVIARALEDADGEPAELARHYGLSAGLAGPEPAIAAYRAAAGAAAAAHDHEQAAAHMQSVLSLLPQDDPAARAAALLELGEQEMLCADMARARRSFGDAAEAARTTGDAGALARAALGFAGGDVGFGWESSFDGESVELLREGLHALGDDEPRLALRVVFRLAYALALSEEDEQLAGLAQRAEELRRRVGDAEAAVLARFTELVTNFARSDDPLRVYERFDGFFDMVPLAEECGREDLLFRVVEWSVVTHYISGRLEECDRAIDRAEEIALRLGSPRFTWEVDVSRGLRLLDRGDREGGEALVRRGGSVVRKLRPDIHIAVEMIGRMVTEWTFDGETSTSRAAYEAIEREMREGQLSAFVAFAASAEGDFETAGRRLRDLLSDDLEALRHPDGYLPMALWALAYTASRIGDREAGARLRPLFEPLRPCLIAPVPGTGFGHVPEWHIGRLELLAGRVDAAVEELHAATERSDACEIAWQSSMARVDLARALHRRGESEAAEATLAEAELIADRYAIGWAVRSAAEARAEIEGRELEPVSPAAERPRPIRALATRGGRRALAATVAGLGDEELERRFATPRRQRTVVKALARGFQPAQARGFNGVIAFELEPYAIEMPPDAPWRWAILIDSDARRARLLEPAPLDAATTIHIGLADWVRVVAGTEDAVGAMITGRCSVEGDTILAMRLEAIFGAR
jgi:class 3 adenylate cyclase